MRILHHIQNWLEAYFWLPLSLIAVVGASIGYQKLTGRPVMENPIWLVDYAEKMVQLILLLVATSVIKQQTNIWLDKDEKLGLMAKHSAYAVIESLKTPFYLVLVAYILLH